MTLVSRIDPYSNAFTFPYDVKIMDRIRDVFSNAVLPELLLPDHVALFDGGKHRSGRIGSKDQQFFYTSYGEEPLFWVSNNSQQTYDLFKEYFDALKITEAVKELVEFDKDIILYSGFFVVGNYSNKEYWHMDYATGANAYTLITPLFEPASNHGNLLYKDQESQNQTYVYKNGEAVILGDEFLHTTEPYPKSDQIRVLLSLTFGTDKLDYWEILRQTIAGQSEFLMLPCGHQIGTCDCLKNFGGTEAIPIPEHWQDQNVSRNALCPCGSEKRYKHCHGKTK